LCRRDGDGLDDGPEVVVSNACFNETKPVGAYCDKKWVCDALIAMLKPHEKEIRAALGPACVFDYNDRWFPIYEYVPLDKFDEVMARMKRYVDVLAPYLDKRPAQRWA
jgi:hypothetical protein